MSQSIEAVRGGAHIAVNDMETDSATDAATTEEEAVCARVKTLWVQIQATCGTMTWGTVVLGLAQTNDPVANTMTCGDKDSHA